MEVKMRLKSSGISDSKFKLLLQDHLVKMIYIGSLIHKNTMLVSSPDHSRLNAVVVLMETLVAL